MRSQPAPGRASSHTFPSSLALAAGYMNIPPAHLQGGGGSGPDGEKVPPPLPQPPGPPFLGPKNPHGARKKMGQGPATGPSPRSRATRSSRAS